MSSTSTISDEKVEQLIDEVEKRPALYKKSLKEYSDANLKKKLWEEVCVAIVDNWTNLQNKEKIEQGRTHFTRYLLESLDSSLNIL